VLRPGRRGARGRCSNSVDFGRGRLRVRVGSCGRLCACVRAWWPAVTARVGSHACVTVLLGWYPFCPHGVLAGRVGCGARAWSLVPGDVGPGKLYARGSVLGSGCGARGKFLRTHFLARKFRDSPPAMGSAAGMAGLRCCAGFLRFVFGLRLKRGHGERLHVRGAGAGPCSLPGITTFRRVLRAMTFCRNSSEKGCQPQAVQAVSGGFGVIRSSRSIWRSGSLHLASRSCFVMGVT